MKKLFTFVAASMVSLAAMAEVHAPVVIDFTKNPNGLTAYQQQDPIVVTVDGVTVTEEKGASNTNPRLDPNQLRWYQNANLTITSENGNIKTIIFEEASSDYSTSDITCEMGTYEAPKWSGDAVSVKFSNTKKIFLKKITVYYEDFTPVEVIPDTIGVSEARKRIDAGNLEKCYVKGIVFNIEDQYISDYHNINCWMIDITNPLDTLKGYKMKGADNAAYNSIEDVEYVVGDTVLFYASGLLKYGDIYEINGGYFAELLGASGNERPVEDIPVVTVAEALEIGNALEDNAYTEEKYRVEGYIVKAYAFGETYEGAQTAYLADEKGAYGEFMAYNCNVDAPGVVEDDFVAVVGKILKYVSTKGTTIEIKSGQMEVIRHEALENVVADEKAQKIMVDGQLYIERAGQRYTVLGTRE
ncbi:MAG: hypothetical protein ACI4TV_05390 [Paludibacteraceae bacterium]